jgi:hypothetical protein
LYLRFSDFRERRRGVMKKTGKGERLCSACGEKGHYKNSNKCLNKKSKEKEEEQQGAADVGSHFDKVAKKRVNEAKEKKEKDKEREEKKEEEESSEIPTGDEGEGEQKVDEEPKVVTPRKSGKDKKSKNSKWAIGDVLLAEMGLPNDYAGTFHPVRIIDVLDGGTKYRCQFLAFDLSDVDVFEEHELYKLFEAQPDAKYKVGDEVLAKIAHRKVRGKEVDGREKKSGVWVKSKVVFVNKNAGTVKVEYNNCNDGTNTITMDKKMISRK